MKALLWTLTILACAYAVRADDLLPDDPKTPLFSIYEAVIDDSPKDAKPDTHHTHQGKLLLTVNSLSDLLLQADKKAVRVVLNEKDTKALAKITREYNLLMIVAGDSVSVAIILVREPRDNGSIMFGEAYSSGAIAEYIRKRFRAKPNANEILQKKEPNTLKPNVSQ